MKQILIFVAACSILFSCSNSSSEEKFELIHSVDSVFTLKNYYKEKFDDVSDPDYVNVSLSMKVYESNQTKILSPDSIPFLNKNVELRKKKVELVMENWLYNDPFKDTIDADYIIEEFRRLKDKENDIFLKNAEILSLPQVLLNGDYNFVINFVFGIPNTDKKYRCSFIIDAIGYGNGGINKLEEE